MSLRTSLIRLLHKGAAGTPSPSPAAPPSPLMLWADERIAGLEETDRKLLALLGRLRD